MKFYLCFLLSFCFEIARASSPVAEIPSTVTPEDSVLQKRALDECLAPGSVHQAHVYPDERGFKCVIDEIPDGPVLNRDAQGHMTAIGHMTEGKMSGHWSRYFPNGMKRDEGTWVDGVPDGQWSFFYDNGKMKTRGRMSAGKKVGTWQSWDTNENPLPPTDEGKASDASCGRSDEAQSGAYSANSSTSNFFGGNGEEVSMGNAGQFGADQPSQGDVRWYAHGEFAGLFAGENPSGWSIAAEGTWNPTLHLPEGFTLMARLGTSWLPGFGSGLFPAVIYGLGLEREVISSLGLQFIGEAKTIFGAGTGPEAGLALVLRPRQWGHSFLDRFLEGVVLREALFFLPGIPVIQETYFGLRLNWKSN